MRIPAFIACMIVAGAFEAHADDLSEASDLDITLAWDQAPGGWTYEVAIHMPTGDPPDGGWPVCILLHGNGGTGQGMIGPMIDLLPCHTLVAPTGYANSWNICAENSDGPDVEMVELLVDQLQMFDNVNAQRIHMLGVSNGSALANNVFIQNGDLGLSRIVSIVSQFNVPQLRQGAFWSPPSTSTDEAHPQCGYVEQRTPATGRRYLCICNENDPIIPYGGGDSPVGVSFVPAQIATWFAAQSQGYGGDPITGPGEEIGSSGVYEYAYLDGDVVHLRGFAAHGMNPTQESYIGDFLDGCGDWTEPCPGDATGDCLVDVEDILAVIDAWGTSNAGADVNGDGAVDVVDLLMVLAHWTGG